MKKVLVTGSQSYIGSILTPYLLKNGIDCIGIDAGFFKDCLLFPDSDAPTVYKDVRDIKKSDLKSIDVLVHLAGISNDPFASFDPKKVYDPVRSYTKRLALICKELGIKFIFASSCSVYGKGNGELFSEKSPVFPQTPYSLNKLQIESDLKDVADNNFSPIILRFATAYGLSPRMRFDLAVNMLSGMAYVNRKIVLNSDGLAWRPFVHVNDISKAILYAIDFKPPRNKTTLLNVGDSSQNFQIIQIARMVKKAVYGSEILYLGNSSVRLNEELIKDRKIQDGADSRNYKISFEKIGRVFTGFKCDWTVEAGVKDMLKKFESLELTKSQFEKIDFYRLQRYEFLIKKRFISESLRWLKMPDLRIITKRLTLRLFTKADITREYIEALNDENVIGLTESRYRNWNRISVEEYIEESKSGSLLIGIFLRSGKHIGNIRLHSIHKYNRRAELGIMIWDKTKWGKGYGTEALNAITQYAFKKMKLHRICAEYYSLNKASARMFEKAGYEKEGILKDHFIVKGKYISAIRIAKINSI